MRENKINFLEEQIRRYLLKITNQELTQEKGREISGLTALLDSMESIEDIIIKQIVPLSRKKKNIKTDFSQEGKTELPKFPNHCNKIGEVTSSLV